MKKMNSVSYVLPSDETRFVSLNGFVVECRIDKVDFSVHHYEDGESYVKMDYYRISNDNGLNESLARDTKFYKSLDDFKAGNEIAVFSHNGHNLLLDALRKGYRELWYLSDGQATRYEPSEHIKKFAIGRRKNDYEIVEGFVPDELFYGKDDVYAWNDITCKDMNGEEYVKEGYLKRLMFNDEQKALMGEFKALTEKMKNAKIKFVFDNGDILALNGEHIEGFEYESYDDEFPALVRKDFMSDHEFYTSADSWDTIFVNFKK